MNSYELFSKIALTLINSDPFDVQMNSVLKIIGENLNVSRIYIFIDDEDSGKTVSNKFEWCNKNVKPQIQDLQNISYDIIPSWKKKLLLEGRIYSENIKDLPEDIIKILEPQQILSIVVYPLMNENKINGFIGFDECKEYRQWNDFELDILKILSGMISNNYERVIAEEKLKLSENNYRTFFNTFDDLIFIGSLQGDIIYTNNSVVKRLGYSLKELKKMNILDLHPVDKQKEASDILNKMFNGDIDYCPLELKDKNNNHIPVETRVWFGKWNGQDCIFGISKDLTKEQEALQKFAKLFENNPALMAISSLPQKKFVDVNTSFLEKLGYSKEEIIGKKSSDLGVFIQPEKQEHVADELSKFGKIKDIELDIKCKDGKILNGLFSGEIIENQGKKYFLTVMVDITEQINLRRKVESQKRRLGNIISGTQLGTWEWNVQTGETIFNERWAEIIGYRLEELKPVNIDTWMNFTHPEDLKKSNKLLQKHFEGESDYYICECRMKHKNGDYLWVLDRGKVIEWDSDGKPLMMFGTHADITENKELQEKIKQMSIRDPLTNIYNRRYLFDRIKRLLNEYKREDKHFSISIIDIDFFKNVNDKYSHLAGDSVLKEFTKIMNNNIRDYDLIGRYGGEEFIIVITHQKKEQAKLIIQRISKAVKNNIFIYNKNNINITFSCGISDCFDTEKNDIELDDLLKIADKRLYKAKQSGRDKIIISS